MVYPWQHRGHARRKTNLQGSFLERLPEFLPDMDAAVRPQEVSKRRARLCAGTGSHAVEPRQPKPANGASWIFHSFLPFPFPPLDPGKNNVSIFANWRRGLWALGWHGPASRVVENAPEKQSGPKDIGAQYQTDMWTRAGTRRLKVRTVHSGTPWVHPGRVELFIR